MGRTGGAHRALPECRGSRDLHSGREHRAAPLGVEVFRRTRGRDPRRRFSLARSREHAGFGPPRLARARCGPAEEPRAHSVVERARARVEHGYQSRPGRAHRRGTETSVRQGGRVRSRNVLSRERAHSARDGHQQPAGLARLCGVDARRASRCTAPAVHSGRQAAHFDSLDRASG